MADNFQFYPGRVKIEEVLLVQETRITDITLMCMEINVWTSIQDEGAVVNFMMVDAKNILSNLPISVGDKLEYTFEYSTGPKKFTVVLEKIEKLINLDNQRTYELSCVSQMTFDSRFMRISKSYSGTTSDMALAIFNKYGHSSEIGFWDQSIGNQKLIVPNWNPLEAISWLAERSKSTKGNFRFNFFQDGELRYHFAPIERWLQHNKTNDPPVFSYNPVTSQVKGKPNSEAVQNAITSIKMHDAYDFPQDVSTGAFGGTRNTFDLNTKSIDVIKYNYWDDFKKENYLNNFPNMKRRNYTPGYIQNDVVLSNTQDNIQLNKVSDKSNLVVTNINNTQTLTIMIKGNSSIDLGQVIEVIIPSPEPHASDMKDHHDTSWSGRYYIIEKRDLYTRKGKQTALKITKESNVLEEFGD